MLRTVLVATASLTALASTSARASADYSAAGLASVQANGAIPMIGTLRLGTDDAPLMLSSAPSQNGININLRSPGTAGVPGPATAHHAYSANCMKQGFYGPSSGSGAPGVGEMDCINVVARQDGVSSDTHTNGGDAGDLGGILLDVQSTLRAQNFTAWTESHTSVVDTRTNTLPYYMDMQEGAVSTIGHPNDDGTQSSMQAWFAALIDGHGSGLKIVEQSDTSQNAGKLGHGIIDNVIEAAHYTGEQFFLVDGNGNIRMPHGWLHMGGEVVSSSFALGTDGNGNIELGSPTGKPSSNATPYMDFNGKGVSAGVRVINDDVGQMSIMNSGIRNYIFGKSYAVFQQPTTFSSGINTTNITLSGGLIFPQGKGNQTVLTTDASGSLHIGGTGSGSALNIDEPGNFSSINSAGDVSGANISSGNSVTIGTKNGNGNHKIVEQSLSATTSGSPVPLTPTGAAESSNNNIAVIASGSAKLTADVVCQNGTDMASWIVKGGYAVAGGNLKLLTSSITRDMPATTGATGWQITPTVDVQNAAAEVLFGYVPTKGAAAVSCGAKVEVIVSR